MPLVEQPPTTEAILDPELGHKNDAETWLAEVLDGSMQTKFEFTTDTEDIYAEDGSSLGDVFHNAIVECEQLIKDNPALDFELPRRLEERNEYLDMLAMIRGELPNVMVVRSNFPRQLVGAEKGIGGYNVQRKQAMLRVITWNGVERKLTIQSQSLDQSNQVGLEAISDALGFQDHPGESLGQRRHITAPEEVAPEIIDQLTGVYDRAMHLQYGGEWHAGRTSADKSNTYDFVRRNQDIVQRVAAQYAKGIYSSPELYDCSATLKRRLEAEQATGLAYEYDAVAGWDVERQRQLNEEIHYAGAISRSNGDTFDGCGMSIGTDAQDQSEASGYGNKKDDTGDCDFTSRECPECHKTNVKTTVRSIGGKKHVSGSCGCKKVYTSLK